MKRRNFLKITLPLALAGKAAAAPTAEPDLTFGVIADPQYADADTIGSRFYRNSLAKLEDAVTDLNGKQLEFVTSLGDLIDRDFKSFSAIMPIYSKLRHPHYPICGNHDFEVADGDKGKVLGAMGLEKAYYSVVKKSWRFVFLDGTESATWRWAEGDPKKAEVKELMEKLASAGGMKPNPSSAGIGAAQMEWLKGELDAALAAGQRVIVFNHYPLLPAGGRLNMWNAGEITDLFSKYENVAAYMNGHIHSGNYGMHGKIHYLNFKGMVETETKTAYATVRCFPDRLEIEGYGLEPDRKLA